MTVLADVNFSVEPGEYISVMGESGSGKTTLLNLLGVMDRPTAGEIYLSGKVYSDIQEWEPEAFRRSHLGFVCHNSNLLDHFSIEDNILLPLVLKRWSYHEMRKKLKIIVEQLGIDHLLTKYPHEVSGGQRQCAILARALITNPKLILADEPTRAFDSQDADNLLRLFEEVNRVGQTIVMATRSVKAASHAGRVLFLRDGQICHQLYRGDQTVEAQFAEIFDTLAGLTQDNASQPRA